MAAGLSGAELLVMLAIGFAVLVLPAGIAVGVLVWARRNNRI